MNKPERLAAIFAIVFAIIYVPAVDLGWAIVTYHPIQGVWQWGQAPPLGGGSPAMYWYGFVITAAIGAAIVTGLAALIPDKAMSRLPLRSLSWVVPILGMIYIGYILAPYATKH
jgi:hypothetical protein